MPVRHRPQRERIPRRPASAANMPATARARPAATLEATNNGETSSRGGLDACTRRGGERKRPDDRVFRDIHGAEHHRYPNTVLVDRHGGGNTTGDDDLLRRHWVVVCAERRGARQRE